MAVKLIFYAKKSRKNKKIQGNPLTIKTQICYHSKTYNVKLCLSAPFHI